MTVKSPFTGQIRHFLDLTKTKEYPSKGKEFQFKYDLLIHLEGGFFDGWMYLASHADLGVIQKYMKDHEYREHTKGRKVTGYAILENPEAIVKRLNILTC